jgi:hypothetical protein
MGALQGRWWSQVSGAHTSGPWQYRSLYEPTEIIGNVDGEYIDGVPEYTYAQICEVHDDCDEWLANSRLICAAPALLAALTNFINCADGGCVTVAVDRAARAAITLATGGADLLGVSK